MDMASLNHVFDLVSQLAGRADGNPGSQLQDHRRLRSRLVGIGKVPRIEQCRMPPSYWYCGCSGRTDQAEASTGRNSSWTAHAAAFDAKLLTGWYGFREFTASIANLGCHFITCLTTPSGQVLVSSCAGRRSPEGGLHAVPGHLDVSRRVHGELLHQPNSSGSVMKIGDEGTIDLT